MDVLKKSGVEDYITKPFDNEDLVRRVGTILNSKRDTTHRG